jgi:hypothetical protein
MDQRVGRLIAIIMHVFVSALIGNQFKWSFLGKPVNYLACGLAFKHRCIGNPAKRDYEFFSPNEYP